MNTKHKTLKELYKDDAYATGVKCGYCRDINCVPKEGSNCIFYEGKICIIHENSKHIYGEDYMLHLD